ncbi:AFR138Wp [Eremothecium gossypii ATCC 10895]|uniref:Ubiquitin-activating enzyme E1-like n=1 Tax=Eremothecium gossypii (strain ATCC 10895 / CBS 109.51 / FGSC 9923 / NRRL Y-1056) TaxID=284811 RepID=Q754D2_EREGS|nr:AFR138Wp [Eremothecium gossypii ATCC 10895]AAS53509.1 AFR138Wp [Eremothecium gossypii ATCC 10895]AEY97821.1 FAFR138Wp [Eremothecium gossypii FDAG1]
MRDYSVRQIIGDGQFTRLRDMKVLLVGAGGIGCELLKNLVQMGFGEVHVVDLDTIEISNLNRQFLFRQRDVKRAKAATAVAAVGYFSSGRLVAHQGNITDATVFPLAWFRGFAAVFNALDNVAARRHVNRMAQFASIPLLESGTAGFDGQVQPIVPGKTECFDCTAKETPRTYPVCTIRSTPSQPVHCVIWAKNFLFQQLFGEPAEPPATEDLGTDDPAEIARIRQESGELAQLQEWARTGDTARVRAVIEKLFVVDIQKLAAIESLWHTRPQPEALEGFELGVPSNAADASALWGIQEHLNRFAASLRRLMERMPREGSIEFDKDDADALEFVATAANIRAHIFHIKMLSVFDIKQIAGNIIPAIVTTNAIIAGLSALVSLRVLNLLRVMPNDPLNLPMAFTSMASKISSNRYLAAPRLSPPNPNCSVCAHYQRCALTVGAVRCKTLTLGELIEAVQEKYGFSNEVSVVDTSTNRLLADFDFDDLNGNTLEKLELRTGSILTVSDDVPSEEDNTVRKPIEFYLELSDSATGFELIELPHIRVIDKETASNSDSVEADGKTAEVDLDLVDASGAIVIQDEEDSQPDAAKRKHSRDSESDDSTSKRARLDADSAEILILD